MKRVHHKKPQSSNSGYIQLELPIFEHHQTCLDECVNVELLEHKKTDDSMVAITSITDPIDQPLDSTVINDMQASTTPKKVSLDSLNSYHIWNDALATHIIGGTQRGKVAFLNFDNETLAQIGLDLGIVDNPVSHIVEVVRRQVLTKPNVVNVVPLNGRDFEGKPKGIAFLAIMILAASRMANEEDIAGKDYFIRLRDVLGLPLEDKRPNGLRDGEHSEEPLWHELGQWLEEKGFLHSLRRGEEGPTKFTNYPISQVLLRDVDKQRLRKLFQQENWTSEWDAETLIAQIRSHPYALNRFLRDRLDTNSDRYQAVIEAIHETYEQWRDGEEIELGSSLTRRHLFAGIYRIENYVHSTVQYLPYPRTPWGRVLAQLQVQTPGKLQVLVQDRPGWFTPLDYKLDATEIDQGCRFSITQHPSLSTLIIPDRKFWILTPDMQNPDSGVYATWGSIQLGSHFILLCRNELLPQLQHLRAAQLMQWADPPRPLPNSEDWVELVDCMVLSADWGNVMIADRGLYEALRPRDIVSISFSGGLRIPKSDVWLEGCGPRLTVFGKQPTVTVTIKRVHQNTSIWSDTISTNQTHSIDWPGAGLYLVEVSFARNSRSRLLSIAQWDEVRRIEPTQREWRQIGTYSMCGAWVADRPE